MTPHPPKNSNRPKMPQHFNRHHAKVSQHVENDFCPDYGIHTNEEIKSREIRFINGMQSHGDKHAAGNAYRGGQKRQSCRCFIQTVKNDHQYLVKFQMASEPLKNNFSPKSIH